MELSMAYVCICNHLTSAKIQGAIDELNQSLPEQFEAEQVFDYLQETTCCCSCLLEIDDMISNSTKK